MKQEPVPTSNLGRLVSARTCYAISLGKRFKIVYTSPTYVRRPEFPELSGPMMQQHISVIRINHIYAGHEPVDVHHAGN